MQFKKGEYFDYLGKRITIMDLLGEGGQGEVYLVDIDGEKLAFKYYKDIQTSDFKYNLKNNIKNGPPSKCFLWPKEYIEFTDESCGYLMDIRPNNYVSFVSYLTAKNRFKSQAVLLNWCIELVNSFKILHERGYSYQDLNDGSFFLDPEDGKLLICDNDNVTADKKNLGILGKMRYMAPEVVRGDKNSITGERQRPDVHSDRFSLAIILFLALCLGNPFEGECLKKYTIVDEKAEYEMFGQNPVYIYSDIDKSNRPIRGYHTAVINRYPYLPVYIKNAFQRTFVEGLKDRENGRVTEIEWLGLLCRYRDELISCSCGKEYIYGFYEKKQNTKCPFCRNETNSFCYLHIGKNRVVLDRGKCLYKTQIDKYSGEYNVPIGKVVVNKFNPSLWGIKLDVKEDVLVKDKNDNEKLIPKDGVIPIINNLKIKFCDSVIGQIVSNSIA